MLAELRKSEGRGSSLALWDPGLPIHKHCRRAFSPVSRAQVEHCSARRGSHWDRIVGAARNHCVSWRLFRHGNKAIVSNAA
jgi:hypothetical protein